MSAGDRSITLQDERDATGSRHIWAVSRPDGSIQIQGQDLGRGVEAAWGAGLSEYEWFWTVPADARADLVAALGGQAGEDPLAVIGRWYDVHGRDPGIALRDAKVKIEFWSRVGD